MKDCNIKETVDFIKKTDSFILTTHINPDADAVGSLLSLGLTLDKLGKKVQMFIDDEIPVQLSFLPSIEKVQKPSSEKLNIADTLIILDSSDVERVGNVINCVQVQNVFNIDHHISNNGGFDFRCLDTKATATCQMLFELLQELGLHIDEDIATCIYAGLASDCGFFRYANTTEKTFLIAAKLIDLGVKPSLVSDNLELQTVHELQILPKILQTLEFHFDNRLASIDIPLDLYQPGMETDAFMKYPRYIAGVEVALMFKSISENVTKISMRSKIMDVSKIALSFGGGGHINAAGCTVKANLQEAKKIILKILQEQLGK